MTAAHITGYIHIGQKVHFDLHNTVALAGLAPTALNIKGKAIGLVAPHFSVRGRGEQVANVVKHTGISSRIGPGGAANG